MLVYGHNSKLMSVREIVEISARVGLLGKRSGRRQRRDDAAALVRVGEWT